MRAHHDVFERFAAGSGPIPNWLGAVTRRDFFVKELNFVSLTPPLPVDSEYFEWIDLLESVVAAGRDYTMIELGAGYGRWTVNAATAVRAFGRSRFRLVVVEAEPTHFEWLTQHCFDNGVPTQSREGELRLLHAAVTPDGEPVDFGVGNPAGWYGQAIADGTWSPDRIERVEGVRLSDILDDLGSVDLIHADIQGAELTVVEEAADLLDATTRRLHIGTHSRAVEAGLRRLLHGRRWECGWDYPCNSSSKTPWGRMTSQDGVQSWSNRRVFAEASDRDYDRPLNDS